MFIRFSSRGHTRFFLQFLTIEIATINMDLLLPIWFSTFTVVGFPRYRAGV